MNDENTTNVTRGCAHQRSRRRVLPKRTRWRGTSTAGMCFPRGPRPGEEGERRKRNGREQWRGGAAGRSICAPTKVSTIFGRLRQQPERGWRRRRRDGGGEVRALTVTAHAGISGTKAP